MKCLDEERLFALVEGAASKKDSALWRKHIAGCERCTRELTTLEKELGALAADEPLDVEAHTDAVMAALGKKPADRRGPLLLQLGASTLAVAAALLLGFGVHRLNAPADPGTFAARGAASVTESRLKREISVDVVVGKQHVSFLPIKADEDLPTTMGFGATSRNIGRTNACALVFLVDALREVHWIYPAYTTAHDDPPSVQIEPSMRGRKLGPAVEFDDVAPGPATVITVITETPLFVSQIEKRKLLTPDALRRAFPDAEVRAVPLHLHLP